MSTLLISLLPEDIMQKIIHTFNKFINHQGDKLLDPPFYIISIVYTVDRTITNWITEGKYLSEYPRHDCGVLIKELFQNHVAELCYRDTLKEDLLLYRFGNMVDSCIHILIMNDCDDDENETTVVVESMHMCCIPTRIMPHTKYKRETVHKINPNYFIHCNYIHNHLHSYFKKYYSTILEDTKLERIIDKFPILRQLNNESMEDIFVSFYRTCGVYLQNISEKEYRWLNRVIYISEYLPISVTINRVDKSFPFVYVNREFEHMTEYTWEETVGKPYTFLQPKTPIANEKLQNKIMTNCVTNGIPVSVIVTNEKKGGRPFYNLLALNPVCDKEGHYLYVVGIQTPIRNGEETTRMNIHSIQNVIDLMYIFSNCNIETDIRVGTTLRC